MTEHEARMLGRWLAGEIEPRWHIGGSESGVMLGFEARLPRAAPIHGPDGRPMALVSGQGYWALTVASSNGRWLSVQHTCQQCVTWIIPSVLHTLLLEPDFYQELFCEQCARWAPYAEFTLMCELPEL